MGATYPNVSGKHAQPSITGPGDFLDAAMAAGWDPGPLPAGVVFTYSPVITRHLDQSEQFQEHTALAPSNARFFVTDESGERVGVSCLAPGAPAMATQLQNLIHLGVCRFASVGTAGAITDSLDPGQVVVLSAAVRDEGVSHHFLPPARYADPDPDLTDKLRTAITARGLEPRTGRSWTTAIPFRMTATEIEEYAADDVLTVEMEGAALFAVAGALGASAASAVVVTDVTTTAGRIREDWKAATEPLLALMDAAVEAVRRPR
jgi:uridine phosphorylase